MNEYFQHNKRSLLILAGLLFILAIVLYFILLRPLFHDISSQEKSVVLKEEELFQLEEQLTQMSEIPEKNVEELLLEKKIPLERKLDEYILSLYQLEQITGSKIERIEFMYDSNLETVEEYENEDNDEFVNENEELLELDSEETEMTIDPVILEEKPENLQVMTVRLTAISPNFEELIELLKAIEIEERISIVTSLRFTKPTEETLFFDDNLLEHIPFEAELTTFYYTE